MPSPPPSSSPPPPPLLRTQRGAQIKEVITEMKMLYTIAFPMIITGLLIYCKSFISMLFLGYLGKDALAGGSLAIAIANISGYSILYGLSLGMEPISSQALEPSNGPFSPKPSIALSSSSPLHASPSQSYGSTSTLSSSSSTFLTPPSLPPPPPTSPSPSPPSFSNPSSTPSRFTLELRTSFPPSCLAPPSPSPSMSPPRTSLLPTSASVSLA